MNLHDYEQLVRGEGESTDSLNERMFFLLSLLFLSFFLSLLVKIESIPPPPPFSGIQRAVMDSVNNGDGWSLIDGSVCVSLVE